MPPRYRTNSIANRTLKRRSSSTTCRQLNVTLLAAEWGSKHGDLSIMSRALAINLAKVQEYKNERVKVKVTFFVPSCSDQEKQEAKTLNVDIVAAEKYPGMNSYACLCFPTRNTTIDVVIGHDVMLGGQAQIIKEQHRCRWVHVAHTDPKELSSKGQEEKDDVVELCENADLVMTVGPKLKDVYSGKLRGCEKQKNVFEFTPGIIEELVIPPASNDSATFKVLVLGRIHPEDFKGEGYGIAVKLKEEKYCLVFVCAFGRKVDEYAEYLRSECEIPEEQLEVKAFIESREGLKRLFCEVDLAIMPSRTGGFGLTALEAFSAGLPILVSTNSGLAHALREIPFGSSYIIEDQKNWAKKIKEVRKKNRKNRLHEFEQLRSSYEEQYSWQKQCTAFVEKIWDMVDGKKCFI